jgi:hypothetical protein
MIFAPLEFGFLPNQEVRIMRGVTGGGVVSTDFSQALRQLDALIDRECLDELQPSAPQTVYTTAVVVMLLLAQRLHGNASLERVVAEYLQVLQAGPSPHRSLSSNTGAYSRARGRWEVRTAAQLCDLTSGKLVEATPPSCTGRRAYILDGTAVTLPSERAFPPAPNQHGTSHWPVCKLLVAHELASGCAIRPERGAMYGPQRVGELTLALRLLPRLPPHSVVLADRNFGVFAFLYAAVASGHDAVVRMTEKRFHALRRTAAACGPGAWTTVWRPSRWDRDAHADLPATAAIAVQLFEVPRRDGGLLHLAITLAVSSAEAAALYAQRLNVETDIRDLKTGLQLDRMTSRSVARVHKEVLLAIVAYNLVAQVRRWAAAQAGVPARRLSFRGTWSLVVAMLLRVPAGNPAQWQDRLQHVLRGAAQRKVPQRPNRTYPRTVLPRRRKFPERPPNKHETPTR